MVADTADAITRAVTKASQYSRPSPVIIYPDTSNKRRLPVVVKEYVPSKRETETQGMLIIGKDLWRNPQVFLGNMQAKSVSILSDMDAIYATFSFKEGTPHGVMKNGQEVLDLTVITTSGVFTASGSVVFERHNTVAMQQSAPVSVQQPMVVRGNPIELKVDDANFPQGFYALILRARNINDAAGKWMIVEDPLLWNKDKTTLTTAFSTLR